MWCGNGGSAADSQHMAAELMGGLISHNRPPIPSIALTTDTSFLTAWTNDTDYETVFSRQIEGLGHEGDVLLAISTSGNSKMLLTLLLLQKKGNNLNFTYWKWWRQISKLSDIDICIPSKNTQIVQEGHLLAEHILCEILEQN